MGLSNPLNQQTRVYKDIQVSVGGESGVLARDFAKPNEINGFALIFRNRNDLASPFFASVFVRLPALAGFSISMTLELGAKPATAIEVPVREGKPAVLYHLGARRWKYFVGKECS